MAGFDNFDDETGINSPPELTGKVILIARQYPTEIVTTPIFPIVVFDIFLVPESIGEFIITTRQNFEEKYELHQYQ